MYFRNRIAQTTNSVGTGDLECNGQINGFKAFAGQVPADDAAKTFSLLVKDGDAWELFESYLITGSPNKLFRGALIGSSAIDGSRITLSSAINKPVYLLEAAETFGPMGGRSRFAVTAGTAPDFTAVFPSPIRALKTGTQCTVKFHALSASADNTFAPDGLAAKPIKFGRPLRKLAPGKILANMLAVLEFNETDDCWIVLSILSRGVTKTVPGTSYTVLEEDHGVRLIFTNAAAVAVTLPQATGQFAAPFEFDYLVAGAGTVTFTPGTSTIAVGAGAAGASMAATSGQNGSVWADGGNYRATGGGTSALTGFITGLLCANNVSDANNDIDIAAGVARDSGDADLMALAATLTKRLDAAWAVGTNQGGIFTGSKANSTWYHVFLIKRPDTGVVDAGFDTSITAANAPASYTLKRYLVSVLTDGSGNIRAFHQIGAARLREVFWDTPMADVDVANPGTSAVTRTLSTPPGVKVRALLSIGAMSDAGVVTVIRISDLALPDVAPNPVGTAPATGAGGDVVSNPNASLWNWVQGEVWTNTSAQVRSRASATAAAVRLGLQTRGWEMEI